MAWAARQCLEIADPSSLCPLKDGAAAAASSTATGATEESGAEEPGAEAG